MSYLPKCNKKAKKRVRAEHRRLPVRFYASILRKWVYLEHQVITVNPLRF